MNKLGQYDDGRSNYNFSFGDGDGKHISISFRAEPDYDLDIIFQEFRNFLIASGHSVEGQVGELHHEEDDWTQSWDDDADEVHAMTQHQAADKFSMENFPNNGWPFGDLTTPSSPRLTTTDFASLTPNQFPTMAPITSQQVQSWTLSSMDIQALTSADLSRWTIPSPGTIGGAKVSLHGGGGILK